MNKLSDVTTWVQLRAQMMPGAKTGCLLRGSDHNWRPREETIEGT